jgi:putative N6-adenine-specific DNA methylase
LKHVFKGYTAWILGYKQEHFAKIGLKPSVKIPTLNGALECEFRKYDIFEGTYAAHKRATATEPPKPRPLRSKDKPRKDDRKRPIHRGKEKSLHDKKFDKKPYDKKERDKKEFGRNEKPNNRPVKREINHSDTKRNFETRTPKKTTSGSRMRKKNDNKNNQ